MSLSAVAERLAELCEIKTKTCTKCGVSKGLSLFGNSKSGLFGRRADCKACCTLRNAARRADPAVRARDAAKRKVRESTQEWQASHRAYRRDPAVRARESAASKRYKAKAPAAARIKERKLERKKLTHFRAVDMLTTVKLRAERKGIPFDLTHEWLKGKLDEGVCELSGMPFNFENQTRLRRNPFSPSVDQIIPSAGYLQRNCRVILTALNLSLADFGLEPYLEIARNVLAKQDR